MLKRLDAECKTCKFYYEKKCRRFPKELATKENDFCGEFVEHPRHRKVGTILKWNVKGA